MGEGPPQELVALLERLDLATAGQVQRLGRRARRLARGLPLFDSVWVDVLVQARILTPFQAGEFLSGRGDSLRIGPYVLFGRLPSPGYADIYLAREVDSHERARLAIVRPSQPPAAQLLSRLESLIAAHASLNLPVFAPVTRVGADGDRVWAASRHVAGRTAQEWIVRSGRFPPQLVLEIARQMVEGLAFLEEMGLCHTDISALGSIFTAKGDVVLPQPGLREIVRPVEGHAHAELVPEAYDYLPPERIAPGKPPSTAGDVYACGCLWWHLLTGRAPIPGGSSRAKLLAAQTVRIPAVSRLAPETPGPLAAAISACIEPKPGRRPESMARLACMLGPPTQAGKRALARYLSRPRRVAEPWAIPSRPARPPKPKSSWLPTTAGCLVAAAAILWSIRHSGVSSSAAGIPVAVPDAINRPVAREAQPLAPQAVSHSSAKAASDSSGEATPSDPKGPQVENRIEDLVLPADGALAIESLELRADQCVRGQPGRRPLVVVPPAGLVVCPEGVRFENIDFVWDDAAVPSSSAENPPAIVHVLASRAEFRGCSFQAKETAVGAPVAIRWTYPRDRSQAELVLYSGQLQLSDCVLRRVGGGVSCETLGAPAVQMANVLYLGAGPLVQLDHCPKPDEPVLIALANVTLRDAGPVLECRYRQIPDRPGGISIQANGCALASRADAALLHFVGPSRPERILDKIRWTGQGSLVLPQGIIAAWDHPEGRVQVLDDTLVSMAGLVRSQVEFAGPLETGPQACRIVRWQVPLRSPDPPGINLEGVGLPEW